MKGTKPYDNKKAYDAGRLRHKISFLQDVAVDNGYGGTSVSEVVLIQTWAGKDNPSEYTQNQLNAGRTDYTTFHYFIIRNRNGFTPERDMQIGYDGKRYIIQTVTQLDDPCTFLKILCAATGQEYIPTPEDNLFVGGYLNDDGILNDSQVYDLT